MQYRIWWNTLSSYIRQPYNDWQRFYYVVKDVNEAKIVLKVLTQYDLRNDLVTDNVGGLEILISELTQEWEEYENEDGLDIWETMESENEWD